MLNKLKEAGEEARENADAGLTESAIKSRAWRAKKKGAGSPSEREEVANLILTIFVVGVAALNVPEEVKPVNDELSVVSEKLTNILARHGLLLGKLSGDALDVVGIIAVGANWYARVAPELRRMRGNRDLGPGGGGSRGPGPAPTDPGAAGEDATVTGAISRADAATGRWLEGQLNTPGGSE